MCKDPICFPLHFFHRELLATTLFRTVFRDQIVKNSGKKLNAEEERLGLRTYILYISHVVAVDVVVRMHMMDGDTGCALVTDMPWFFTPT